MSHLEQPVTQCHAYISAPTREEVVKKWGRIRLVYDPSQIEVKGNETKVTDENSFRKGDAIDQWEIHFVGHPTVVKHALELAEGS